MSGNAHWKLVPKLNPEYAEHLPKFTGDLADTVQEIATIGVVARLLSMKKTKRRSALLRRKDLLQRQITACHLQVGIDIGPPRIGIDEAATEWYRKYLAKDESVWPLPPDEMIEEMKGHPVWELCKKPPPFDLGIDWPKQPLPMPEAPGISAETQAAMAKDLSAEEAVSVAERLRTDVLDHVRRGTPAFADAAHDKIVRALQESLRPGGPQTGPSPQVVEVVFGALSAALWLEYWGRHGYAFTTGKTVT